MRNNHKEFVVFLLSDVLFKIPVASSGMVFDNKTSEIILIHFFNYMIKAH